MPQEDDGTSQLNHPEEILWVVFPANDDATIVMKPREQAFDFPPTTVAAQHAAILGGVPVRVERCGAINSTPKRSRICSSSGSLS